MFTLAHLSDWHLASRPAPSELIGKRGLGYINWHRSRKKIHRPDVLDATIHNLKAAAPDHIAVTGDLVNLSLPDEYNRARGWLQTLGSRQSRHLCPQRPASAGKILGGLYARRRRHRPLSVPAPARQCRLDRAVDGAADGAVAGDRTARQTPAGAALGNPRSDTRLLPHRAQPSSTADATLSAAPGRCRGFARRARRQGRRAFAARPRSPPRRGLARWAAEENPSGRRAVGVGVPQARR